MRIKYNGSEYEVTDKSVQHSMLANGGVEVKAEVIDTPKAETTKKPTKKADK